MTVKRGLAQMLKGGVIMDVIDAEQAEHGGMKIMHMEFFFVNL